MSSCVGVGAQSAVRFPLLRISVREPWGFAYGTLDALVDAVRSGAVGTVRVPLRETEVVARLQRVEGRLDRLGVTDRDEAAREFGEVTLSAEDLGMRPVNGDERWERGAATPIRRPTPRNEVRVEKARRRFGRS